MILYSQEKFLFLTLWHVQASWCSTYKPKLSNTTLAVPRVGLVFFLYTCTCWGILNICIFFFIPWVQLVFLFSVLQVPIFLPVQDVLRPEKNWENQYFCSPLYSCSVFRRRHQRMSLMLNASRVSQCGKKWKWVLLKSCLEEMVLCFEILLP